WRYATARWIWDVTVPRQINVRHLIEHPHHALHDVVYVREAAAVLAVVEDLDRLVSQDRPGEQEQRHVWPAPRAVDREEAQACRRYPVEMGVAVRHHLVRLLGGGVERQRVLGGLLLGER